MTIPNHGGFGDIKKSGKRPEKSANPTGKVKVKYLTESGDVNVVGGPKQAGFLIKREPMLRLLRRCGVVEMRRMEMSLLSWGEKVAEGRMRGTIKSGR